MLCTMESCHPKEHKILLRKRPGCLGKLELLIFIFYSPNKKYMKTTNVSIVLSGLDNKSKSKTVKKAPSYYLPHITI